MKYAFALLLFSITPIALAASAEEEIRLHAANCDASDNSSRNCNQSRLIVDNLEMIGTLADRLREIQGLPVTDSEGTRVGYLIQEGSDTFFKFRDLDVPNQIGWTGSLTGDVANPPLANGELLIVESCSTPLFAETTNSYSEDNQPTWIINGSLWTSELVNFHLENYQTVQADGSCGGMDVRPSPATGLLLTKVHDEIYTTFPLPWVIGR